MARNNRNARTNVRNGAEGLESTLRERFPRSMPAYGEEHPYARAPLGHWMTAQDWLPPREELQNYFPTAMRPGQSMANPYEQGMYAPQTLREGAAPSGWIYGPDDVRGQLGWKSFQGYPEEDIGQALFNREMAYRPVPSYAGYGPVGLNPQGGYGPEGGYTQPRMLQRDLNYMPPGDPRLSNYSPQRMLERPTGRPSRNVGPSPMFFPTLDR